MRFLSRLFKSSSRSAEGPGLDHTGRVIASTEAALAANAGRAGDLSGVEAVVGLFERSMLAVKWTPAILPADVAAVAARALLLRGNAVLLPNPMADGYRPQVASGFDVSGDGRDWLYRLDVPSPNGVRVLRRRAARVWHFRLGADERTPWCGRSPLDRASDTCRLLVMLESALRQEASAGYCRVLAGPITTQRGLESAKEDLAAAMARSSPALVLPVDHEFKAELRSAPAETMLLLRRQLVGEVAESVGVPSGLLFSDSAPAGPSLVQSWRRYLSGGLGPLLSAMAAELAVKTGQAVEFDYSDLRLADTVSMARAVGSLAQAGVSVDEALDLAGFGGE